jgi:hypothetical protein
MMNRVTLALLLCTLTATASAQTRHDVEYVAGDRPWKCGGPCRGVLVLDGPTLTLTDRNKKHPKVIFVVPLTDIAAIREKVQFEEGHDPAIVFGTHIAPRDNPKDQDYQEYLIIETETATGAGALTFHVGPHAAADLIAKITFAVKKAKAAPPA